MSTAIGTNLPSLLSYVSQGATPAAGAPSTAQVINEVAAAVTQASTNVTLSDEAKAYLASLAQSVTDAQAPAATLATNARTWFDQQYKQLGISSAMVDGQVAVDLSGQSRATLSAVASNTQGLFTKDETAAATQALQSRFNDALAPQVVIARHTGDYATLYNDALDYMDQAGADEKATASWQAQHQALVDGAAAAQKSFGKAPDTGDADDPVSALLAQTTATGTSSDSSIEGVAANARAMLNDQANAAKDNGTQLVFNSAQKNGQQVDFSNFDNRSLAAIVLNQGSQFSPEEIRAAKGELDRRNRTSILSALNQTTTDSSGKVTAADAGTGALTLLQQYDGMSAEEKSALGVTDQFANNLVRNYRSMQAIQSMFGANTSSNLASYI